MNAKSKKKPMTARERKQRAECREDMRNAGLLPPKKKPLNRAKFVSQAKDGLADCGMLETTPYLIWALSEMLDRRDYSTPTCAYSLEAVGAAKVILLALGRKKFDQEHPGGATVGEMINAVMDIFEA